MDIKEMHNAFLVLGQQMGMQNMRNILPSEIDVFLNAAIIEEVRKVVLSNVNANFTDKVTVQKNNISPINFIRTLYRGIAIPIEDNLVEQLDDVLFYTSVFVEYTQGGIEIPCRIIEPDELAFTLSDYCNAPSKEYPIVVLQNDYLVFYPQPFDNNAYAMINYVKNPTKVSYANETSCNLPEYTHNQIVETAINKYFASVGSTTN